ncbi:alpha/beta hydrolase [filamentous cyanobacterium CCP2]|nr:alpha/beta hydrolase [filamentous cyanobacterium CCP2]
MLKFQPPGFGQRVFNTSLGIMAYYTPVSAPWRSSPSVGEADGELNLPPLVFLHSLGGGSSAYEWSKVYPAFAAAYRVIAPDLIGWGQSTHPERSYRPDDYMLTLFELLDWLGEPAVVVASSLTAGLTVRLAIQRPELFKQLFLVCPAGYGESGADYGRGIAAQVASIPGVDRLLYSLGAANEFAVRNFLENFLFANRSRITSEMVDAYLASAQQFNAEFSALSSLRGDLCFNLEDFMGQLQVPTWMVWGTRSRFGSPKLGQRLANLNPQFVKLWTISDVGVLPHLETPGVVAGLLHQSLVEFKLGKESD